MGGQEVYFLDLDMHFLYLIIDAFPLEDVTVILLIFEKIMLM